jgi:sec-independent protein translocase protein TatA
MLSSIGPGELALIVLVALLLFGAGRLATVGRGLGDGVRNFRRALRDGDEKA